MSLSQTDADAKELVTLVLVTESVSGSQSMPMMLADGQWIVADDSLC